VVVAVTTPKKIPLNLETYILLLYFTIFVAFR